MLIKLLKYDIKSIGKSLIPLYLIVILLGFFTRISNFLSDKYSWIIAVSSMVMVLFVVVLIGSLAYTFIISIKRFYVNLFRDEGYLTNTLPVQKAKLLISKLISSIIYIVINVGVIALALIIAFFKEGLIGELWTSLDNFLNMNGLETIPTVIFMTFITFLSYINYILMFYTALSLGQKHNERKLTYAVVYGIAIYMIIEVIMLIALGILVLITPNLFEQLEQEVISIDAFKKLFTITTIVPIMTTIAYYCVTLKMLKNRLNLE